MFNKKGVSIGFLFIIVLIVIFAGGLFYIILNQVYTNYLFNSTIIDNTLNTFPGANATQVTAAKTTADYFWYSIPVFMIVMLILYVVVKAQAGRT